MVSHVVLIRALQRYWRWRRGLTLGAQDAGAGRSRARHLLVRHGYRPGLAVPRRWRGKGQIGAALPWRVSCARRRASRWWDHAAVGVYANFAAFPGDHALSSSSCAAGSGRHCPRPTGKSANNAFLQRIDCRPARPGDTAQAGGGFRPGATEPVLVSAAPPVLLPACRWRPAQGRSPFGSARRARVRPSPCGDNGLRETVFALGVFSRRIGWLWP